MITHITCQHALSGIGRYGFELTKQLHHSGDLSAWYKPYKKNHPDSYLHKHDWIKGYAYKSFRSYHAKLLPYFIQLGVPKKTDIAHAHWFLSGLGAIKKGFKQVVITMHDVSLLHESEQSGDYERYYAASIEKFKRLEIPIICVSEQAKKDAIHYAAYPEHLVHAIPNGIEHDQFNLGNRIQFNRERFRVIYSGGLGKRKNLDLLLRSFQQVQQQFPEIELHIAGAHPERTAYPKLVQELGLKNVEFTGFIPDAEMANFYRDADLFVFPSLYEGFGFAPLEAMACGTPTLVATGGAIKEISGAGSLLFEYDIDDLATKMIQVIESSTIQNELQQKGLNHVKKYTWEQTAILTKQVYSRLK